MLEIAKLTSTCTVATTLLLSVVLAGCGGGEDEKRTVTWNDDIAPLVEEKCNSCHASDGIAPFAFDSYANAKQYAKMMMHAVDAGQMPPWLAHDTDECKPRLGWKDDLRVSAAQKQLLRDWVNGGTVEGNGSAAAALTKPPSVVVDNPSASLEFRAPFTVEGDKDIFQCFVLDPGNTEKVWVTEIQLNPGNERVDHHGIVFMEFNGESEALADENGTFECLNAPDLAGFVLGTWTPGAVPMVTPPTSGMPMPAGARIVVQMHYHPAAQPEVDQSVLDVKWTTEKPQWEAAQALLGNFDELEDDGTGLQPGPNDGGSPAFMVPAGISNHVESMLYRQDNPFAFPIFSIGTHMHYVGTDMKVDLIQPTIEDEQCLIQTPKWDFNWQRIYSYDAPIDEMPRMGPGDEIRFRCSYDNSLGNQHVREALAEQGLTDPVDVALGDETLDEMCIALLGILMPHGVIEELFDL
jgi:hypothetical protein